MGRRVFSINASDREAVAEKTICAIEQFFTSIGMPVKLSACGLKAQDVAARIYEKIKPLNPAFGEHGDISPAVARKILSAQEDI